MKINEDSRTSAAERPLLQNTSNLVSNRSRTKSSFTQDLGSAGGGVAWAWYRFKKIIPDAIAYLRSFNYIGLLLLYSVTVCLALSIALYLSVNNDHRGHELSFLDSIFVIVSAYSASGLSTVDYTGWDNWCLAILALGMELGCIVLLTTLPSIIRYRAFRKEYKQLLEILSSPEADDTPMKFAEQHDQKQSAVAKASSSSSDPQMKENNGTGGGSSTPTTVPDGGEGTRRGSTATNNNESFGGDLTKSFFSGTQSYQQQKDQGNLHATNSACNIVVDESRAPISLGQRIVYEDALANVSQQMDICCVIIWGCLFYWFVSHALFTFLILAQRPFGWTIFTVISAFNNAGFALSQCNFCDQVNDNYVIFWFWVLMPLGNTLFPVFFRLQTSLLHRGIRRVTRFRGGIYAQRIVFGQPLIVWQHSVRLFLRHPRAYFTHMFSKKHTLMIFLIWLIMTCIGVAMFVPDFNNWKIFPDDSPFLSQLNIALFQTITVRTTGFAIMDIDALDIGHLAYWVLAMYIAAYPFIVAERASANQDMDYDNTVEELKREATNVIGRDLFWLYLSVIVITFAEKITMDNSRGTDYSAFLRIVFEVSSAFGNVGLSLALPNTVYSFSGALESPLSVIVVILVMYCGKHRGLPTSVDESINIHRKTYLFDDGDNPEGEGAAGGLGGDKVASGNDAVLSGALFNQRASVVRIGPTSPTRKDLKIAFDDVDEEEVDEIGNAATSSEGMLGPMSSDFLGGSDASGGAATPPTSLVSPGESPRGSKSYKRRRKRQVEDALRQLRTRLVKFYEYYNPARIQDVERIVEAFWHNPVGLMANLTSTYGPEPGRRRLESEDEKKAVMYSATTVRKRFELDWHEAVADGDADETERGRSNSVTGAADHFGGGGGYVSWQQDQEAQQQQLLHDEHEHNQHLQQLAEQSNKRRAAAKRSET